MRCLGIVLVVAALALGGCGASGSAESTTGSQRPAAGSSAGSASGADAVNSTDVMFLQMSLEHIRQGDPVLALAEKRAVEPRVRELAAGLRAQWRAEAATMAGWLGEWGQPSAAAPDAGVHAGHGDLHSLRPADVAELEAATGADFDRTALSLLLGHLHNTVETLRMETSGGSYPPAISLAATMTTARQAQIQQMLALVA